MTILALAGHIQRPCQLPRCGLGQNALQSPRRRTASCHSTRSVWEKQVTGWRCPLILRQCRGIRFAN
jgi:hypothetical protein